jgi:hypothetical protein
MAGPENWLLAVVGASETLSFLINILKNIKPRQQPGYNKQILLVPSFSFSLF